MAKNRNQRAEIAQETVNILETGLYKISNKKLLIFKNIYKACLRRLKDFSLRR